MRDSIMLYKHPGPHEIHGDKFDYVIVHSNQMDSYLAQGWSLTTEEAKNGKPIEEEKEPEAPAELRSFESFDEFERLSIRNDKRAMMKIAKIHNTSYHTIRKIKGKT